MSADTKEGNKMPVTEIDLAMNRADRANDEIKTLLLKINELEKRISVLEKARNTGGFTQQQVETIHKLIGQAIL